MDGLPLTGTVKFYDPIRGFGFIYADGGGEDVFVGRLNLEKRGLHSLEQGVKVSFVAFRSRRGSLEANHIRVIKE